MKLPENCKCGVATTKGVRRCQSVAQVMVMRRGKLTRVRDTRVERVNYYCLSCGEEIPEAKSE